MLNYSNFLKVSNFKKSQVPESEYFQGLVLESEENGPSDPRSLKQDPESIHSQGLAIS